MLKPVQELAALVRGGEIAAREVVSAALARIEDLDERVNAFVEVDAERARGRRRDRAGRRAAVRRRADRDQGQRPGRGLVHELRVALPRRPPARSQRLPRAAAARGRLRRRRHDEHARVRDPADDRAAPQRADAQPVGPRPHARRLVRRLGGGRRGRACCRWRTATTAAARCASRPPAAGWSASSRAAAASRAGPTSASRSSPATACSRAPSPRRRRCSTCWPATRSATPPGRRARSSRTRPRCGATPAACGWR